MITNKIIALIALSFVAFGIYLFFGPAGATSGAITVMSSQLRAPASTTHSVTVLDQRKKGDRTEYIVHDIVSAPNDFGVRISEAYCLRFETQGSNVYWDKFTSVQRCNRESPQGDQLVYVKTALGW